MQQNDAHHAPPSTLTLSSLCTECLRQPDAERFLKMDATKGPLAVWERLTHKIVFSEGCLRHFRLHSLCLTPRSSSPALTRIG